MWRRPTYGRGASFPENSRGDDNLEQQAQALFKAWFVDFEPFKDGKFVDSELGSIPEGWRVVSLGEITKQVAEKVKATVGFGGALRWDASKPDGTPRKLTDVSKLHRLGWHHRIDIDEGIRLLYQWYRQGICINHIR